MLIKLLVASKPITTEVTLSAELAAELRSLRSHKETANLDEEIKHQSLCSAFKAKLSRLMPNYDIIKYDV